VLLYYYNPELDEDSTGNIQCSEAGLVAVMRELPASVEGEALIGGTIRLLISGELSNEERAQGVTTEFPLEGLKLTDVRLDGGVLTLTFDDPNFRTSGGACRSGVRASASTSNAPSGSPAEPRNASTSSNIFLPRSSWRSIAQYFFCAFPISARHKLP